MLTVVAILPIIVIGSFLGYSYWQPTSDQLLENADSPEEYVAVILNREPFRLVVCACDPKGDAAYSLKERGDAAVPAILEGIYSEEGTWEGREILARVLGWIDTPASTEALDRLATDSDDDLVRLGRRGLAEPSY